MGCRVSAAAAAAVVMVVVLVVLVVISGRWFVFPATLACSSPLGTGTKTSGFSMCSHNNRASNANKETHPNRKPTANKRTASIACFALLVGVFWAKTWTRQLTRTTQLTRTEKDKQKWIPIVQGLYISHRKFHNFGCARTNWDIVWTWVVGALRSARTGGDGRSGGT